MIIEYQEAYGLLSLVIINSLVFIIFAFSFAGPRTRRDWRSFGAFSAFLVALPAIGYLAALEAGPVAGAAFGALIAAGSLGQAVGSFPGGAGYAGLGIQIFTAAALAMGLGAALGARYCPPVSVVGIQPRPQAHRSAEIND